MALFVGNYGESILPLAPPVDLDTSLQKIFPNITYSTTPCLDATVPLYFGATLLGERRINSIAVLDDGNLVGDFRFLDAMRHMYPLRDTDKTPQDLLNVEVKIVMSPRPNTLDIRATLRVLLRLIESSRTGSVFIVADSRIVGQVTLTGVLRWLLYAKPKIDATAADIASSALVSASKNATIGRIVELMLDRYVRKVILRKGRKIVGVVDDRGVTNMIFGSQCNRTSFRELFKQPVTPQMTQIGYVKGRTSLPDVSLQVLRQVSQCVLVEGDGIVTPWDIAIKGLRSIAQSQAE